MSSIPERKSLENDPAIADLRERIAKLETHVFWMKKTLEKIDKRQWYILASVIISILIAIATKMM